MSKFIDKLVKITKGDVQAMGFTTSISSSILPQMLTVVGMRFEDEAKPLPVVDTDAMLLYIDDLSKEIESLDKISKEIKTDIWGIEIGDLSEKEAKRLVRIGCDFIVLKSASSSSALMYDEKLGKLIEIGPTIDNTLIGTINMLSVDAVIVREDAKAKEITVERLMIYRNITAIVQKPVLISMPASLATVYLYILNDISVNGLLLDWSDKTTDKKIGDIKEAINALPKSGKKKADKMRLNATLPNLPSALHDEDNDFEELKSAYLSQEYCQNNHHCY